MKLIKHLQFLKVIDCFGSQIKIYHKRKDSLKSVWGGFFTICIGLTIIVLTIQKFEILIKREGD